MHSGSVPLVTEGFIRFNKKTPFHLFLVILYVPKIFGEVGNKSSLRTQAMKPPIKINVVTH